MNTFDRYIIRHIFVGFVALVVMLSIAFVAFHYVEFMDDFLDRGATTREVFMVYYPSSLPEIVKLVAPLALFLSAIFITSKIAQELQFVVLMSSGVSLYRLLVPYLLLGSVVTAGIWAFNGWIVPEANRTRIEYEYRYFKDQRGRQRTRNIHLQNSPSSIVTTDYFDRRSNTAYVVSLQQFDNENRLEARVDAGEMHWIDSTGTWRLFDVVSRRFPPEQPVEYRFRKLVDTTLAVLPRDLRRTERDVELLTIPEAREYLDALHRSGASNIGQPEVEYWSKFTYPFANLILVMISLPLAAVRRPGGNAIQLGIGVGVAFVYLAMLKLSEQFAYSGSFPPFLAAALPHILFGAIAIILIARART